MSLLRLLYFKLTGAVRERWGADQGWYELEALYDSLALPRQWIVCPHCGSQAWRYPPHGIEEPCPLVNETAKALGMRFDAERMASLRQGTHAETVTKALNDWLERRREEGDDLV